MVLDPNRTDACGSVANIAIIGAGPVGLACAKYFLAEKAFEKIDIFEQRHRVGGIWNISSADRTKRIPIPQEDPMYGSTPVPTSKEGDLVNGHSSGHLNIDSLEFESPLYDYLETNIPKPLMQYSDTPFPDWFPLYPSHQETLQYLESYADDVRHLIKFGTQIQNVEPFDDQAPRSFCRWEVEWRDLETDRVDKAVYDAVVIASGHYTVPHVVYVDGLAEWNKAYPGSVLHSKAYRRPETFQHQRVLVIGNSASGTDLAAQIGPLSSRVYLSSKSVSIFGSGTEVLQKEDIDEVVEFLPSERYNRAVRTKDGRIVENLDAVIFATGYFYSFPFLSRLDPPIITNGLRTRDVYQHFLHIEYPTMALPVLNIKVIPFSLAENQAAVIARLWSGRLPIPSKEVMRQWEQATFEAKGKGKHYHLQGFPESAAQMNDLYQWAQFATIRPELQNDGKGKLGSHWEPRQVWMRSKFVDIKSAYTSKGDERRKIRTIQELGFDFDVWLQHAAPDDMSMFEEAKCIS